MYKELLTETYLEILVLYVETKLVHLISEWSDTENEGMHRRRKMRLFLYGKGRYSL